jgi:methylenetetrahydrofolate/methylenetetrahydromethanopterin dehydrogenase (NADP+)
MSGRGFNVRMTKPKILIQLDTDSQASVFDAVVAVDAGVQHLLQYNSVTPDIVRGLVHGAMYTRGPADLQNTAIFVGGSNVSDGEKIAAVAHETLFDPFRVSIMLDSNGSNSTAAAAVLCASKHHPLEGSCALVMAGTGAVGQRVCQILANAKCTTFVASRTLERSKECIARLIASGVSASCLAPLSTVDSNDVQSVLNRSQMVFGCGAAGVRLLTEQQLSESKTLRVAIDLNAVPPLGLEGIDLMDKAKQRGDRIDYGALGVGGLKMKIHKASIAALFASNSQYIGCEEMLEIGRALK